MSFDAYDANSDRIYYNGDYYTPYDIATCPRCGIQRRRNPRNTKDVLCRDCHTVVAPSHVNAARLARYTPEPPAGRPIVRGGITRWIDT